jgi:hypothetical protein
LIFEIFVSFARLVVKKGWSEARGTASGKLAQVNPILREDSWRVSGPESREDFV